MKAQRGNTGIALLSLISVPDGGEWLTSRPGRFTPGKRDPVSFVPEAGLAPWPVWTGAEYFVPTGIRSPNLSVQSKSHKIILCNFKYFGYEH